mgnify:CR=1 FL=1
MQQGDTISAIATPQGEGGIGVIHKNMSISQQAEQVDMVKRSENGVITNPFWLAPAEKLQSVRHGGQPSRRLRPYRG